MRTVLLILLASTAALALTAVFAGRGDPRPPSGRPVAAASDGASPLAATSLDATSLSARLASASLMAVPPVPARAPPAEPPQVAARPKRSAQAGLPEPVPLGLPLTERTLSQNERGEPVPPELQEAIDRIEPVYDPTRLDGPFSAVPFRIWPGTASLTDIFGEHWHLASDDPNVNAKVRAFGLAWRRSVPLPCEAYTKNRPHQIGDAALSDLSAFDCSRLQRRQVRRFDDAAPIPVVAAPITVPVFAAPPPGARMSSEDFWAAQQARVAATRAYLQRKWQAARSEPGDLGLSQ